jgi:hypothetical protein
VSAITAELQQQQQSFPDVTPNKQHKQQQQQPVIPQQQQQQGYQLAHELQQQQTNQQQQLQQQLLQQQGFQPLPELLLQQWLSCVAQCKSTLRWSCVRGFYLGSTAAQKQLEQLTVRYWALCGLAGVSLNPTGS